MSNDNLCAISKLWTGLGWALVGLFVPFIFYIRGGNGIFGSAIGSEALQISMAFWGILVFGVGFCGLSILGIKYIKKGKKHANYYIKWPTNTMHESPKNRDIGIAIFFLALFTGIPLISILAGVIKYSSSHVSEWGSQNPLALGFFNSRYEAFKLGCLKQPCFRIHPQDGHEYILYITDGLLLFVLLSCAVIGSFWIMRLKKALNSKKK